MRNEDLEPMPTRPEEAASLPKARRHRTSRRAGLAILLGILVVGAANLLGVRQGTVSATGGGYGLEVTYASVSRPGLATPWSVEVRHPGGFAGPVTVATTADYFELFDENALDPEPAATAASSGTVIWEFDPPPGQVLAIRLDARLEPTSHLGQTAETSVLVDGAPVVSVRYTTRVMP